ncbi:MAG: hypothetical protein QOF71_3230, partial [Candidatus Eremiobacteraeota bacterium]|nr:hypothetical protein [Candidatus Eremiobacteraeota bacterium]
MTRADLLAATVLALAPPRPALTAAPRDVSADVTLERQGTALLAPFTVAITLRNAASHVVQLRFPTADLFRIDVLRDEAPVWSSVTGHKPIPITRQLDVPPGLLRV